VPSPVVQVDQLGLQNADCPPDLVDLCQTPLVRRPCRREPQVLARRSPLFGPQVVLQGYVAVLEIQNGIAAPRFVRSRQAPGQAWDDVVGDPVDRHPFAPVEFILLKPSAQLIVARRAAIEDVEDLVSLAVIRSPVDHEQASRLAVHAEFLA